MIMKFEDKLKEIIGEDSTYKETICKLAKIDELRFERLLKGEEKFDSKLAKRVIEIVGSDELEHSFNCDIVDKIKDIGIINNYKADEYKLLDKLREKLSEGIEAIDCIKEIKLMNNNNYDPVEISKDIMEQSVYQLYHVIYWLIPGISSIIKQNDMDVDYITGYMNCKYNKIEKYIK